MTYPDADLLLTVVFGLEVIFTVSNAICTVLYCIRMRAYERAILSAKDCKTLVVRPPFRLWKKFTVSEVSDHAENTSRK